MGWIESRLKAIEMRLEYLYRLIQALGSQTTNTRQQGYAAWQGSGSGSGSGGTVYFWVPGSTIAAASGVPPSGVPVATGGQTVYALSGGSYSTVSSSAVIYNAAGATLAASKVAFLAANSDGTYTAVSQSCT